MCEWEEESQQHVARLYSAHSTHHMPSWFWSKHYMTCSPGHIMKPQCNISNQCVCCPMPRLAYLKYLVVSFLPRSTGVLPTAFLITQLPLVTLGMSLNVLWRLLASVSSSPPRKRATHQSNAAIACAHNHKELHHHTKLGALPTQDGIPYRCSTV